MAVFLRCSLLLLVAVAGFSGTAAAGEPVVGFEVVGDPVDDTERIRTTLGIEPGAELDRVRIRRGVLTLFAGGEIEYFSLSTRPRETGVVVVADLRLKSRIASFEVQGVGPIWQRRIENWFELRTGMPVSAAGIETGVHRALSRVRERGWANAEIDASVDYDRATNTVAVLAEVDLGKQQRLAAVRVAGLGDASSESDLLPEFKVGKPLTSNMIADLRDTVEANLRRSGFFDGVVQRVGLSTVGAEVELEIVVIPGLQYDVRVEAPEGSAELVEAAVPDPAHGLHPAQTEALAERIRNNLSEHGYLLAAVEVELEEMADVTTLLVTCDPGPKVRIAAVGFPGRESVSEKRLRRVIRVSPGRTAGLFATRVSASSLERDRAALETLYRQYGFRDVQVHRPTISRVGDHEVEISFLIDEGRRWLIEELRFENFPVEVIAVVEETRNRLAAGSPWNPEAVTPLCRTLEAALAGNGYPRGTAGAETTIMASERVRLTVRAEPGPFILFGDIIISGLKQTRESVVAEVLRRAGLVPGRPYSNEAIIEAQSGLYGLGLFRAVEIVPIPGHERRLERGLVVRCEEGPQRSVLFGVGWDTEEDFRITLGWGHSNLLGGAHAFSVETRASSRQLRVQANLRENSLFGSGIPGYAVVYSTQEELADYTQDRFGTWVEIGDRRRPRFRHWLRFEYQLVDPDAPEEVLSQLEREDQHILLASLLPVAEWDTRDDPLSPKSGMIASSSLEYAFPLFQAEHEFLKLQASLSKYRPMWNGRGALGLRFGAIQPLGDDTGEAPNIQIPLAARFFAGGRTTHRAFARDRLGIVGETIDDEGNAIGGNALLLFSFEYVRSIWGWFAASVFVDAGNVWAQPSDIALGDLRWGLGVGLRYETPAGPFRLEYARKLDREVGEASDQLYFSFGVPF